MIMKTFSEIIKSHRARHFYLFPYLPNNTICLRSVWLVYRSVLRRRYSRARRMRRTLIWRSLSRIMFLTDVLISWTIFQRAANFPLSSTLLACCVNFAFGCNL